MEDSHRDGKVAEVSEELEKSLSIDTDDKMERYHRLIQDGKDVARAGNMVEALQLFRRAHDIQPSQKLGGRIRKIEELLAQNEDEDEDEEFVDVNGCGLMLFKELHDKLYAYQREGVAFLYSLYRDGRGGGILADDMGLGKTIQVISFLSGMYDGELVKHVLLVMPMSLITNWTKEFAKWTPGMRVKEFHGASKAERTRNLEKVQRRGGVVVTTYSMLMNNWQQLASFHGREFTWDHVILDEAHKIKSSSTKTAKSACAVPSKNRVLLTGTPVQNNLREMWALFDFACQGTLLGTAKTFKAEYENPITRAREKDATPGEKALGSRMSETLMAIIQPYFLRRTKADVQRLEMNDAHPHREEESDKKGERSPNRPTDGGAAMPKLMRKNDLIVWTYLSAVQEDIYRQFISLDHIKELLMTSRSPLAELNILKKLCDHPRLLSAGAVAKLGLEESGAEANAHGIADVPDDTLISESGKLVFLFALLERLRRDGHRTLVFAHYRKVLDIVERILGRRGFDVLRLDGTVTQIAERERRISLFQTDRRYSVFLLTTQVGGVGITLTAANRVVIYDPSWNPATDAQAVDRVYRIGQTENVVIYRLITCGTVEEKIYRRQVFKDSLIRQSTGDKKNPFRYFSKQELKELFTLEDPQTSSTQLQLQALHSRHRRTDPELDRHIAGLHAMNVFGISDHDLMFSLDVHHDEAPEDQEEHRYIEGRVQKAQELTKAECELQMQLAEGVAASTEPAWLRYQPDRTVREPSREKKPRTPKPSPSYPRHDNGLNGSPALLDLDLTGSGQEDDQQNPVNEVIDLTADASMTEEQNQERSDLQEALVLSDSTDGAGGGDASVTSVTGDVSLKYVTAVEENGQTPFSKHDESEMDFDLVSENKRLSVLQVSNCSFRGGASSRTSAGLESFNFNLQLEDSDAAVGTETEDGDAAIGTETEDEEWRLLSRLQTERSFDIDRSLCEKSIGPTSMNESIVGVRKKRAAVIYDSEEEDDDDDDEDHGMKSQLDNSFQVLGASTPKSAPSSSAPLQSRRSVGGNVSVSSRRSLLLSIIEDMDVQRVPPDVEGKESEIHSDEAEEEDVVGPSHDGLQLEETLKTEEDEEEEEQEQQQQPEEEEQQEEEEEEQQQQQEEEEEESADIEEMSLSLEESSSEAELGSSERMDQFTAVTGTKEAESESYESLVLRGREFYNAAQLDDALTFFLRAIDMKPGDPEVQLMTIQLYRQLSKRS
ncbi:DNA excision repair protein ERCC-6-like [Embiotoca jacksoni]|uniref:DNA excision repair protein ERCC-6-like n=1 Tax=Embiotoca jacksoni TaxID=100190 RepID=UPI003703D485